MIRHFFGSALTAVLLIALAALWLVALAVQEQPLVAKAQPFSPADASRAKQILKRNDPRVSTLHNRRSIQLSQADLQLLTDYLLSLYGKGVARITLNQDHLLLHLTFALPPSDSDRFLNLELRQSASGEQLPQLSIGDLRVPDWLTGVVLREFLPRLLGDQAWTLVDDIEAYRIDAGLLTIRYLWHPGLAQQAGRRLLPALNDDALRFYNSSLDSLTRRNDNSSSLSLVFLLQELFRQGKTRPGRQDPVVENRALLLVVGLYVNGHSIEPLLTSGAQGLVRPLPKQVVLQGRHDLAQHFSGSAALTAIGSRALADAAGLFKELDDSRKGSGFSFRDLAADIAGARFGEAVTDPTPAGRRLEGRIAAGLEDRDLMPETHDLPEYLSESQFERRFGGTDGSGYRKMREEIEQRVASCRLYRDS